MTHISVVISFDISDTFVEPGGRLAGRDVFSSLDFLVNDGNAGKKRQSDNRREEALFEDDTEVKVAAGIQNSPRPVTDQRVDKHTRDDAQKGSDRIAPQTDTQ